MYCPACRAEISDDQKYCRACGKQVRNIAQIVRQQEDLGILEAKQKDYFAAFEKYLRAHGRQPLKLNARWIIAQVIFWLVIVVGAILLFEFFKRQLMT